MVSAALVDTRSCAARWQVAAIVVALSRQQALRAVRLTLPTIHGVGRPASSQGPELSLFKGSIGILETLERKGTACSQQTCKTHGTAPKRIMAEDSASEPKPPGSVTKKGGEAW